MKNIITLFIILIFCFLSYAQSKDTIVANQLSEVVVTGQLGPQSIKKSVFNVRVISKEDINKLAANNPSEVLTQYLNINV